MASLAKPNARGLDLPLLRFPEERTEFLIKESLLPEGEGDGLPPRRAPSPESGGTSHHLSPGTSALMSAKLPGHSVGGRENSPVGEASALTRFVLD